MPGVVHASKIAGPPTSWRKIGGGAVRRRQNGYCDSVVKEHCRGPFESGSNGTGQCTVYQDFPPFPASCQSDDRGCQGGVTTRGDKTHVLTFFLKKSSTDRGWAARPHGPPFLFPEPFDDKGHHEAVEAHPFGFRPPDQPGVNRLGYPLDELA